ncbi:MAG: DMT family transporter [Boseongicola sp.]|nr:DMT family transporter [Boseongicola sp.]MDD9977502.1 DMT family transporter [Boseongicola sp.]
MSAWLISLEGTEAGKQVALFLALMAAFLHALFGALQKGKYDPYTTRTAIDASYALIMLPVALFLVPWPEPEVWSLFAIAWVIHVGYKLLQASAYSYGAYTVVYPVVRGTGPVFTVIGAGILFGETFGGIQWLGVATLASGILGLAVYNLRHVTSERALLPRALGLAVLTGGFVALYTTWDAFVIRATADPLTFVAWFFFLDGLAFPIAYLIWHRGRVPRPFAPLAKLGITGAIVAIFSFGGIMLATRLDKVGEAAVLRETSVVFAALIAFLLWGERVGPRRLSLMGLIALGAVLVEWGG